MPQLIGITDKGSNQSFAYPQLFDVLILPNDVLEKYEATQLTGIITHELRHTYDTRKEGIFSFSVNENTQQLVALEEQLTAAYNKLGIDPSFKEDDIKNAKEGKRDSVRIGSSEIVHSTIDTSLKEVIETHSPTHGSDWQRIMNIECEIIYNHDDKNAEIECPDSPSHTSSNHEHNR